MIDDDDSPVSSPAPAPDDRGPVSFRDTFARFGSMGIPDAARVANRYMDYDAAHSAAREALTRAKSSVWDSFAGARDAADAGLKRVVGTFRGNADRIADEAVDGLTKTVTRARDYLGQRLGLADAALWSTSARGVATRDETDGMLSMPPLAAAYVMIEARADESAPSEDYSAAETDGSGALGGGPAGPGDAVKTREQVIADAVAFGTSLRGDAGGVPPSAANPPTPNACGTDSPSIADQIANRLMKSDLLPAPIPRPPYEGVPQIGSFDSVRWFLDALEQGGVTTAWTNSSLGGEGINLSRIAVELPDGSSMGGDITTRYAGSGLPDLPEIIALRSAGMLANHWPVTLDAFAVGCRPVAAPPPPPPPPYVPPYGVPPMGPPPPPATCCPAPQPVRASYDATRPVAGVGGPLARESNWCEYVNGLIGRLETLSTPAPPPDDGSSAPAPAPSSWLATAVRGGAWAITTTLDFLRNPVAGGAAEALALTFTSGQALAKAAVATLTSPTEVNLSSLGFVLAELSAAGWGEAVSGAPLKYVYKDFDYMLKYMIPKNIPDQSTIDKLYITSSITDDEWECYTRSLGNLPRQHRMARDVDITTPNIAEQVDMYMRGMSTFPQLREELKRFGVKRDDDISYWIRLREQIPQFADIVRFMVRDTENPTVVAEGQLDSEFGVNFNGQLEEWARMQGVSPELAIRFWRAHWEMPSPTQAYQMLHRLRPGRVAPELQTTEDSVRRLLGTADYAPGWRDRMIAVSYLTPTRTDIKQGYSRGVYSRAEVIEMLQDTGLDANGAKAVARLYDFDKDQFQRTRTERQSAYTVRGVLNDYTDGVINKREATTLLEGFGFDAARIDAILASADLKAVVRTRRACTKAVRRQYFVGRITNDDAQRLLIERGYDADAAEEIGKEWECERSASVQEVPARKNLDWAVSGVITLDELARRLRNLRYGGEDIERYVAEATRRMAEATAKAAAKAVRDILTELRRREADARKRLTDLEKRIKDAEKKTGGDKPKRGG